MAWDGANLLDSRTGKRSTEGALQDGVNSVMRYVKNNFLDGSRQDSYDLVTGSWIPRKGQAPWRDDRALMTRAVSLQITDSGAALMLFFLFFSTGSLRVCCSNAFYPL